MCFILETLNVETYLKEMVEKKVTKATPAGKAVKFGDILLLLW